MNHFVAIFADWSAAIIEALGIGIIAIIALYALMNALFRLTRRDETGLIFQELRQVLGRGILLGLEFLIAADIIYTVSAELTFESIGVLALVIVIRTFLSFTLEVEVTGRWPWQRGQ